MSEKIVPLFGEVTTHNPLAPPPANLAAEQQVLGACLMQNRAYDRAAQVVRPEHFADPAHGEIFAAMGRRIEAGKDASAVSLLSDLGTTLDDALKPEGGLRGYLPSLITACISTINVADYAAIVRDAWVRRQAIAAAGDIIAAAYAPTAPDRSADQIVNEAVQALLELGQEASQGEQAGVTLGEAVASSLRRAEGAFKNAKGEGALRTGIRTVDDVWGGLWPGQLYYLMAGSNVGKSPLMAQIARNVATGLRAEQVGERAEHVHVVSLEMTAEDYAVVNLAQLTPYTARQIRGGDLPEGGWTALLHARAQLDALPLVIDAPSSMTMAGLATRCRVVQRTKRTRLILIDYMQLIQRGKDQQRMQDSQWVPYLGNQLKALAKALSVPVVALCQVNKSSTKEGQRPVKEDLPYDGGQAADGIFAIYRPEQHMGEQPPEPLAGFTAEKNAKMVADWWLRRNSLRGVAEFGCLKARYGEKSWKKMRFDGPRMTFLDHAIEPEVQPEFADMADRWGD